MSEFYEHEPVPKPEDDPNHPDHVDSPDVIGVEHGHVVSPEPEVDPVGHKPEEDKPEEPLVVPEGHHLEEAEAEVVEPVGVFEPAPFQNPEQVVVEDEWHKEHKDDKKDDEHE
jgi:hypothetical protein